MNNFYLLSFVGGINGDFICSRIGELQNFYKNPYTHFKEDNLTEFFSTIDSGYRIKSAHRPEHLIVGPEKMIEIKNILESKNIIIPTHYQGIINQSNIPNLIPIKLHGFVKLTNLSYALFWIKRWAKPWLGFDPYQTLIQYNIKHPLKYAYEKNMAIYKYNTLDEFVKQYYHMYRKNVITATPGWTLINADSLFLEPHQYIANFNKVLNLDYSIDPDIIREYHNSNVTLIENTFNQSFTEFFKGDWLEKLYQWVRETCPDS